VATDLSKSYTVKLQLIAIQDNQEPTTCWWHWCLY